ncbi:MAG: hypothetical protein ABEH83_07900 [Halobacterium sp.]
MTGVDWLFTVAGGVALVVLGYAVVGSAGRREWARDAGRSWARRLGVLGAVLVAVAAGMFSVWPPGGVYVLAVAGVSAFLAGVFATAGAAGLAERAADASTLARRVRVFWYAAAVHYRATRAAFALAFVAFGLAAVVAGVTVNPIVSAVGAVSLGGVFASLLALAVVGVFVPGGYDESVATAVRDAR